MSNSICLDAPSVIVFSDGVMERDARLLVAGDYPGKNLKVTEADLDALVANFSGPVPVKVEHIDSPLDPLGLVERVWRDGAELRGRIKFPAEMAAFLSKRDAHKLSVGLLKEPQWKLLEASLTLTPHVPTATLLSDGEKVELVHLRQQVRKQTVDAQIAELKASGKVIPATEALARVLLSAEEAAVVTLSDGVAQPVAATFRLFLDAQPPLIRLGEIAPGQAGATTLSAGASGAAASAADPEFSDEETEVLRRLGVEPAEVAKTMAADRQKARK
jgi:hypothetical protein